MFETLFIFLFGISINLPAENHSQLFHLEPFQYIDPVLKDIEKETNVPTEVLYRLIQSESAWDIYAESPVRKDGSFDIGLAQIHSGYLEYFTIQFMNGCLDPNHPVDSLRFAARYLKYLYDKTGCWYQAVVSYKIGLNRRHLAPEYLIFLSRWVVDG